MMVLWMGASYLVKHNKNHLIASLPATFMTAVSVTYILQAQEGFKLPTSISYPVGIIAAIAACIYFNINIQKIKKEPSASLASN
ncbi:MAG: hypothetical protein WBJ82_11700 [Tepidanaerobacteraceae bacterium]|nr:hypothetical protein [Tepidanaerobacter sp.]HQE04915.1 hypothetical protein [Tepidanaerobacteraceae bacterium]